MVRPSPQVAGGAGRRRDSAPAPAVVDPDPAARHLGGQRVALVGRQVPADTLETTQEIRLQLLEPRTTERTGATFGPIFR
jgi:hypothetical protein